jgi:hypothetical protein
MIKLFLSLPLEDIESLVTIWEDCFFFFFFFNKLLNMFIKAIGRYGANRSGT